MTAVQVTWAEPRARSILVNSCCSEKMLLERGAGEIIFSRCRSLQNGFLQKTFPVHRVDARGCGTCVAVFRRGFAIPFAAITATGWGASGVSTSVGLPGWSLKTSLITCIMLLRPSLSKLISSFASSNNPVNKRLFEPKSFPNAFLDAVLGQQTDHLYGLVWPKR